MISMIIQLATAFGAGVLASVSPCVYPLLPTTLGFFGVLGTSGHTRAYKKQVIYFSIGQMLVFFLLGMFAVMAGGALGFTSESEYVQIIMGFLFLFFGLYSISNQLKSLLDNLVYQFKKKLSFLNFNSSFKSKIWDNLGPSARSFFFGMGTSFLVTPCTTPILSSILTLASTKDDLYVGAAMMLSYSIGFGMLLLIVGLGFINIKKLPKSGEWMNRIHVFGSIGLIGVGVYYLYQGLSLYFY